MSDEQRCNGTNVDGSRCSRTLGVNEDGFCANHGPGLSDREEMFIAEYLKDMNATQAAIRSGYSAHSASVYGPALRKKPKIRERIDQLLDERRLSAEELIEMLRQHATASAAPFLRVVEEHVEDPDTGEVELKRYAMIDLTTEEARNALHLVKEIKHDSNGLPVLKLHDSQAAIVHLAKIAGLFIDKVQVDHVDRRELRKHLETLDDADAEEIVKAYRESLH